MKEHSKCQEISSEDMKLNKNIRNNRQQTREEQLNEKCAEIEKLQKIDATGMHKKIKKEKRKSTIEIVLFNRMPKIIAKNEIVLQIWDTSESSFMTTEKTWKYLYQQNLRLDQRSSNEQEQNKSTK